MENKFELFTAYIDKELSGEELKSFEIKLKEDIAFKTAFEDFKEVYNQLEHFHSDERAKFAQCLQDVGEQFEADIEDNTAVRSISWWKTAVAASVILAIGWFSYANFGSLNYDKMLAQEQISLGLRSEAADLSKQAENAFNNKDYEQAIVYFDQLLTSDTEQVQIQYYKAYALFKTKEYEEALASLKPITQGSSAYVDQASLLKGILYFENQDFSKAKESLENISKPSEYYKSAQKLLKKIK